jgi:hypothetical protein
MSLFAGLKRRGVLGGAIACLLPGRAVLQSTDLPSGTHHFTRCILLTGMLTMSLLSTSYAQSSHPFVPPEFEVPATLETERFRFRMLTVNDVVKDFEAVTTTEQHLHDLFGSGWPEGLTLEQNLIDLGWHQKEFQRRSSFAYTVVALDESRVLGCVYINPTRVTGYDSEVYRWARQSELASGLEDQLEAAVRKWLKSRWPFRNPALPGRDMPIAEWEKLPLADR